MQGIQEHHLRQGYSSCIKITIADGSTAHLLGPGLALPTGDAKAEGFAESMYTRLQMSEDDILTIADLPPLDNPTITFLQEILCKMSTVLHVDLSHVSDRCVSLATEISSSSLSPLPLSHRQ